jgi:hypothetical protein
VKRQAWGLASALFAVAALGLSSRSSAQRATQGGPLTVVVGEPAGEAFTERLDGRRANASRALLPTSSLRIRWTRPTRPTIHPPVITRDGHVIVVGNQGDTVVLNPDGTDRAHMQLGPGPMSSPAVLTDGTLVVVNGAGDAIGVRRGELAFRTEVAEPSGPSEGESGRTVTIRSSISSSRLRGGSRTQRTTVVDHDPDASTRAWLLPMDDGGFALAFDRSLVLLDSQGTMRARALSPAPIVAPLVALDHSVAFVGENGEAFEWDLSSSPDAVRARGSFGMATPGPVGAVVATDARHLLAVVDGTRLVSLDLRTGATETRVSVPHGGLTGTFALGSGTTLGGAVFLEEVTLSGTRVLQADRDGQSIPFGTMLSSRGSLALGDAGGAMFLPPTDTKLFTDPSGRVAYATIDGHVGVASATAKVELGALPCGAPLEPTPNAITQRLRPTAGFAGLVPAGPAAFVVACLGGSVSLVEGTTE